MLIASSTTIHRRGRFPAAVPFVILCLGSTAAAQSPVGRFMASLENDPAIPAEAAALIRTTWEKCQDCDGNEFLTQGLAVLSPAFRAGLDAYDAERYEACVEMMGALRSDANPFVATHAAVYEIKALVALERMLEAGERIERLTGKEPPGAGDVGTYTYLAAEIAFLRGFVLLADLQYEAAADALSRFLRDHPGASQRLVIAAEQMLAELRNRQPGQIGEVVDLMNFAGRRLNRGDSGEDVQQRQQRIIELLDKLVEDAEQQESSSNSSSSSGGGGGGRSGQRVPSNPMQQSQLPGGKAREGPLRGGRRANPAEVWGSMPPAERQRILQALKDNFPGRYRRLVEQYYEELAKKP